MDPNQLQQARPRRLRRRDASCSDALLGIRTQHDFKITAPPCRSRSVCTSVHSHARKFIGSTLITAALMGPDRPPTKSAHCHRRGRSRGPAGETHPLYDRQIALLYDTCLASSRSPLHGSDRTTIATCHRCPRRCKRCTLQPTHRNANQPSNGSRALLARPSSMQPVHCRYTVALCLNTLRNVAAHCAALCSATTCRNTLLGHSPHHPAHACSPGPHRWT
jgi:hypothetical protein